MRIVNAERREGEVNRVLTHANDVIVGTFENRRSGGLCGAGRAPHRLPTFMFPVTTAVARRNDDKVVVRVTQWGKGGRGPRGRVIEVLGNKDDIGTDVKSLIRQHKLDEEFPQNVLAAAAALPQEVDPTDIPGRVDLRETLTFTIDGATAMTLTMRFRWKDRVRLDARRSHRRCEPLCHARPALDREAYKRGTSVYLLDRVLPMLPEALSNGLCSLNPDVDRLTMSCMMELNDDAQVLSYKVFPSVIHSHARLVYDDVSRLLTEGGQSRLYAGAGADAAQHERCGEEDACGTFLSAARWIWILTRRSSRWTSAAYRPPSSAKNTAPPTN